MHICISTEIDSGAEWNLIWCLLHYGGLYVDNYVKLVPGMYVVSHSRYLSRLGATSNIPCQGFRLKYHYPYPGTSPQWELLCTRLIGSWASSVNSAPWFALFSSFSHQFIQPKGPRLTLPSWRNLWDHGSVETDLFDWLSNTALTCMHRTQKQPPHTAARYIPTWSVGLLGAAKRKRELFLALVETGRHSTSKGGVAWPPVSFVSMCIMAVRILASS